MGDSVLKNRQNIPDFLKLLEPLFLTAEKVSVQVMFIQGDPYTVIGLIYKAYHSIFFKYAFSNGN